MKLNERENTKFYINSSCAVFIITTLFYVGAAIYIGVCNQFPFWYILPILISFQLIITVIYVIIIKVKLDIYSEYGEAKVQKALLTLTFLELIFLNIFAFIYGIFAYVRVFVKPKTIF